MINMLHVWTSDKLRLQGIHYEPSKKDTLVLFIHGMSGNFIENYFTSLMGEQLQESGYGFLYGHNRGYNHINDIAINEVDEQNAFKTKKVGAVYERFEDSVLDIDAWYKKALELGYQKIVLVGHSLGCNKVIHYIYMKNSSNVEGVVLLSPPDMVANAKESGHSKVYEKQLKEAKKNIQEGNPDKLLTDILWNWYYLSSQTFVDMFEDGCPADNLPIMRNPERFSELESISVPVLAVMGEFDDIAVRSLEDDMNLLELKTINAASFSKVFVAGANHVYDNRGKELTKELLKWLIKTGI
jgi:pimeloyl-ACP methyl ester carboxylesterase